MDDGGFPEGGVPGDAAQDASEDTKEDAGDEMLDPALSAVITFPPRWSATANELVTVIGRASDSNGGSIGGVSVNGVNATSNDGFRTWSAAVPLDLGANVLTVRVEGEASGARPESARADIFNIGRGIVHPHAVKLDPRTGHLLVAGITTQDVVDVDPNSQTSTLFSGGGRGTGPEPSAITSLDFDPESERWIAADTGLNAILAIDAETGDRTVVTGLGVGDGAPMDGVIAARIVPSTQIAIALDRSRRVVLEVDLVTGQRTVISGQGAGTGPDFSDPFALDIDTVNDRAFVGDASNQSVYVINLVDGDREILASPTIGSGPQISAPEVLRYDPNTGRLLVGSIDRIVAIDPVSRSRSMVSGPGSGVGESLHFIRGLDLSADGSTLFATEYFHGVVIACDLATGNRRQVFGASVGDGPRFDVPANLWLDLAQKRMVITDRRRVMFVDLADGSRQVLTGDEIGTGPAISGLNGGQPARTAGHHLVIGGVPGEIWDVDLSSGARSVLASGEWSWATRLEWSADPEVMYVASFNESTLFTIDLSTQSSEAFSGPGNAGPSIGTFRDIELDVPRNRLYAIDSAWAALIEVDPLTGDRAFVSKAGSESTRGEGPAFQQPLGLAIDASGTKAYVADRDARALFAVDLASGARAFVTSTETPGYPLTFPLDVVVDDVDRIAYVSDSNSEAIYAVSLDSGERVIMSK